MEIKWTIQGGMIYTALATYLLAFLLAVIKKPKAAKALYIIGFLLAVVSFIYRWLHVHHVPMQNLFEVFVTMGILIYPLSVFSRKYLRVGVEASDMLLGAVVLFPAGFIFSAQPQALPPALQCWLFAPHVAVYIISYVIMAKAAVQALGQLSLPSGTRDSSLVDYETATYHMICLGFPLMTLGLVFGSWWGHLAWGDWWGWDPKELWSLVTWLVYLGYLHFRYIYGRKYKRINSIWALVGIVAILITLLWVNLAKLFSGLHSYAT